MDTRPSRIPLTGRTTVLLPVCVAFFPHRLGAGPFSDGTESWPEDDRWPMRTAGTLTVASALTVPAPGLTTRRPGEGR